MLDGRNRVRCAFVLRNTLELRKHRRGKQTGLANKHDSVVSAVAMYIRPNIYVTIISMDIRLWLLQAVPAHTAVHLASQQTRKADEQESRQCPMAVRRRACMYVHACMRACVRVACVGAS